MRSLCRAMNNERIPGRQFKGKVIDFLKNISEDNTSFRLHGFQNWRMRLVYREARGRKLHKDKSRHGVEEE